MVKRIAGILIALAVAFSQVSASLASDCAAEHAGTAIKSVHSVIYNPLYSSNRSETQALKGCSTYFADYDYTCTNENQFESAIRSEMVSRNTSFTIKNTFDENNSLDDIMNGVFSYDDPSTSDDFDYLHYNYQSFAVTVTTYPDYSEWECTVAYLTTASQEAYVDTQVGGILSTLGTGSGSSYSKIKKIHDYICDNVTYDNSLINHSAYNALSSGSTVCQGYALLTYKMLADSGVPSRIISGQGNGGNHVWNIVEINGLWYDLDVTWDDCVSSYTYFLKSNADFPDHIRDSEYNTASFNSAYPMSKVSYSPSDTASKPSFGIVRFSTTALTNKDVAVTVMVINATVSAVSHTFKANGSYTFKAADKDGNTTTKTITVSNIDKVKPVINVSIGSGKSTRGKVTVTASDANLKAKTIKLNGKAIAWPQNNIFSAKGTYAVTATDKAGNTSTAAFAITK